MRLTGQDLMSDDDETEDVTDNTLTRIAVGIDDAGAGKLPWRRPWAGWECGRFVTAATAQLAAKIDAWPNIATIDYAMEVVGLFTTA